MDLKKKHQELENCTLFQEWKHEHPTAYLVHFFCINEDEVQIAYYEQEQDAITTFTLGKTFTKTVDKEILKEHKHIPTLHIEKVGITEDGAKEAALSLQKQKYSGDQITKQIIVLQTIDNEAIYNMTFVTMTFKMWNVRVNAMSGKIIFEQMRSLMDLAATIESKKTSAAMGGAHESRNSQTR